MIPGNGLKEVSSPVLLRRTKPPFNVAIGKPVRASSLPVFTSSASDVTDNDITTDFRTRGGNFSFVVVDLEALYDIDSVAVYFGGDEKRVFELRSGLEDLPGPDFNSYTLLFEIKTNDHKDYLFEGTLNKPIRARFVSLQIMDNSERLEVMELKVIGREI
ncbi:Galactose-binding domain-like [Trinorchestia longiramus]|nr:Galactose-binding domain-like [Trinorchestia longiramus]